jgi:hypothetical protein
VPGKRIAAEQGNQADDCQNRDGGNHSMLHGLKTSQV